jgi:hypothetical protein
MMSRPRLSVPNGCAVVGGLRRAVRLASVRASYECIAGVSTAIATKTTTMTRPARAAGLATSRRHAAAAGLRPWAASAGAPRSTTASAVAITRT